MLDLIMGLLGAFDVSTIGDLAEAGFRISNLTEVVPAAGYKVAP